MSIYYQSEDATVLHGDALALLRELPTHSVDALLTDPPYSSGGMMRGDRTPSTLSKYVSTGPSSKAFTDFSGDNRDQRSYAYWMALWLSEAQRVVKPGGVAALFSDWRQLPATTDSFQAGGFVWRGIVPWYKPAARNQMGRFTASCEYVIWGSAGPMERGDRIFPGFYQASSPRDRVHHTQKPLEVMRELIKVCPVGGVVLDPFMGSGTTGVAALIEGRRFLGIEQVEHYAEVAVGRLSTVERGYVESEQAALPLVEEGAS